jgi:hypothetical protein
MADPVVPSGTNTLTAPARHLPLGWATECPAGSARWTVWVPSNMGGELKVELPGGSSIEIQDAAGNVLGSGAAEATYAVPRGKWGEVLVFTRGGGDKVTAQFTQTCWARQSASPDADPLIPCNFWFWPSRRSEGWALRATQVMERYAVAVGKDAAEAGRFERQVHEKEDAKDWEGHCHNAAPASALFEQPSSGTIGSSYGLGGKPFDAEEIKLLAAEFVGNYGQKTRPWWMDDHGLESVGRHGMLGYLKPGGPRTTAELIRSLTNEAGAEGASETANRAVARAGGEAAFAALCEQELGRNAATFLATLLSELGRQGQPLVANLRAYDPQAGPEEVWNQVCFHFIAAYIETAALNDPCDLQVYCYLTSNNDKQPPTKDPPARVRSGIVYPGKAGEDCLQYLHHLRLAFGRDGTIDGGSPRNRWLSVKNHLGQQLYAPLYLETVGRPSPFRNPPRPPDGEFGLGNPVVGRELLKELTLQPRFR